MVRFTGSSVSVEVGKDEVNRLLQKEESELIICALSDIGFSDVQLDPDGYTQGKLNTKSATA
jgi:PP-loop superfamily ATP-utilizing enzyme